MNKFKTNPFKVTDKFNRYPETVNDLPEGKIIVHSESQIEVYIYTDRELINNTIDKNDLADPAVIDELVENYVAALNLYIKENNI